MNKASKKRSILEEILKMGSGSSGKPIIVVPAADVKGNISLKNTKMFLEGGKYLETECEEIKKILSA